MLHVISRIVILGILSFGIISLPNLLFLFGQLSMLLRDVSDKIFRRSLDQFGYPYLPNTYDRDNDQVVTKLIPLRDKEERNSFWDSVSSAPQGTNASFAHHAQREEHMLVRDYTRIRSRF